MSALGPLEIQRRISLSMSFAFSAVGFAVGLNALVKCVDLKSLASMLTRAVRANQERTYINHLVVPHGIIDIGIHGEQFTSARVDVEHQRHLTDVFTTGAVITVICALLAILSCVFCVFTWCPTNRKAFLFRVQSCALFLCAVWLLATLMIYDYFFATRSAQITVNLHGQRVPEAIIQRLADLLDFTYAYRDVYFCASFLHGVRYCLTMSFVK